MIRRIKIKYILDPIILVPFLYVVQFILYLLVFDRLKNDVYLLEDVPTFLNLESLLKYMSLFFVFYIGILLGRIFKVRFNLNNLLFYKINSKIVFLFFILTLFSEFLILVKLKNEPINVEELKTFAQLTYITIQNEEAWYRTFLNFSIFIGAFYFFYFKIFDYKTKKVLLYPFIITILVLLTNAILFAQRQILIVFFIVILLFYLRLRGYLEKRISFLKIIVFISLLFGIILLTELLRYGMFNAFRKNIELFSFENIADVIKYLLTAYFAKDVNNALIALASEPTYNFFSTGSKLLYKIILIFKEEQPFIPIVDPGPHGTVNFLALLWIDFGYLAFFLLPLLGFLIGMSYNLYMNIKGDNFISLFLYSIVFAGILSGIRINFFFLNIFIYNFILILVSILAYYLFLRLFSITNNNKYVSEKLMP